ncbi:MAG: hypothetical protein MJZ00_05170 [Paludibacteraceae bacterium]|nr:hypothetical protein [Paludibacteraceae bacterium]
MASRKISKGERLFLFGVAAQKLSDTERRLFDDLDYDRISRKEYDKRMADAQKEYQDTLKKLK